MSTSIEAMATLLQETINSNKLSSSRVDKIKTLSTQNFHEPVALVSTLLKSHLQASASSKLSSFYIFDAVVRHAQDVVRKNGTGFDSTGVAAPKGSGASQGTAEAMRDGAAAFMPPAEGVIREVALSTLKAVPSNQKEKVKKIVDIWIKAGTFETGVLRSLQDDISKTLASEASGSTTVGARSQETRDPRRASAAVVPSPQVTLVGQREEGSTTPLQPPPSSSASESSLSGPALPANVLALLANATKGNDFARPASSPTPPQPPMNSATEMSSLQLLQQLMQQQQQQQQGHGSAEQQKPPPSATIAPAHPPPDFSRPPPNFFQRPPPPVPFGRPPPNSNQAPPPQPPSAPFSPAGPRNSSRTDSSRNGGWRGRDDGVSSSSPSRQGGSQPGPSTRDPNARAALPEELSSRREWQGRGRSPNGRRSRSPPARPPPPSKGDLNASFPQTSSHVPRASHQQFSQPADHSSSQPSASASSADSSVAPDPSVGDLTQFNLSTFDPTDPASWARLAQMWNNTYGYFPSQEEVMMVMMTGMNNMAMMNSGAEMSEQMTPVFGGDAQEAMGNGGQVDGQQGSFAGGGYPPEGPKAGRGRGRGRGRG